ncbi:MAG: osmoprotectant transport system substrate-binding protein [Frankiaceae bacterium]|jgi:osmoprotectant transport system substrate-binding protein|nr:osmoprotectant transport system substrate-binding protein [Frankiaceae bacterium]
MQRRLLTALPAISLAAVLAACGGSSSGGGTTPTPGSSSGGGASGSLTVGAAGFTESNLLAQMYADLLEKAGFTVNIKTVSSQEIFQSSLEKGTIAVVPEYAATYANSLETEVTGNQSPTAASPDLQTTLTNLEKYATQKGLTHLDPANAVDQNAFAVTTAYATQHHLTTLSDLGASGLSVKLAAPAECATRPFCKPGLQTTYKIKISSILPLAFDSLPAKQAVKSGKVQMALVATTDATLSSLGLVLLTDDKHLQNADNLIPIVNKADLAKHPEIATAINPLASVLTTADLGTLDNQVDGQRQTVADVATAYLTSKGLL